MVSDNTIISVIVSIWLIFIKKLSTREEQQ